MNRLSLFRLACQAVYSLTLYLLQRLVYPPSTSSSAAESTIRRDTFSSLMNAGAFELATNEAVWLWRHLPNSLPNSDGTRLSFLASDIKRLAQLHPPARHALEWLRAEGEISSASNPIPSPLRDLSDWIVLNWIMDQPERTLAWFDSFDPRFRPGLDIHPTLDHIFCLLISRGRWKDAGLLYRYPVEMLRIAYPPAEIHAASLPPHFRDDAIKTSLHAAYTAAARMIAALRVAGREAEAEAARLFVINIGAGPEFQATVDKLSHLAKQSAPVASHWYSAQSTTPADPNNNAPA